MEETLAFKILTCIVLILYWISKTLPIVGQYLLDNILSIISLSFTIVLGVIAVRLSLKTDRVIKAVADLDFDSKLAMMTDYLEVAESIYIKSTPFGMSTLIFGASTLNMNRVREDFTAVSNLRIYEFSPDSASKKKRLISEFICPIVEKYVYQPVRRRYDGTVLKIIEEACDYDMDDEVRRRFERAKEVLT